MQRVVRVVRTGREVNAEQVGISGFSILVLLGIVRSWSCYTILLQLTKFERPDGTKR